jgi:hypothetical protein
MWVHRRGDQIRETVMRSFVMPSTVAIAVVSITSIPAAALTSAGHLMAKAAVSHIIPADYSHRRHYSGARAARYRYQGRVPRHLRGFEDPGYAYHGNINGCVIDQGYGRWASCSSGR